MTSSCVEGDLDLLTLEECPTKRKYISVSEHDISINIPSKLVVHTNKTKITVFQKRGRLSNNLKFYYNNLEIEIVS